MRGAGGLVAGTSDVPAVWLRRLLRQVKEQARPRAFPPNWPSLDPALQGAGYGLGVVLRGRGASRPDMTEVLLPGLTGPGLLDLHRPAGSLQHITNELGEQYHRGCLTCAGSVTTSKA